MLKIEEEAENNNKMLYKVSKQNKLAKTKIVNKTKTV